MILLEFQLTAFKSCFFKGLKDFHAVEGVGDDHLVGASSPLPVVSPDVATTEKSDGMVVATEDCAVVQGKESQGMPAAEHNSASGNAAIGRESADDKEEETNVNPSTPKKAKTPTPKESPASTPKIKNSASKNEEKDCEYKGGRSHHPLACIRFLSSALLTHFPASQIQTVNTMISLLLRSFVVPTFLRDS